MKNRTAASILAAYTDVFRRLQRAGLQPRLARLDNECSAILKRFFQEEGIEYQLAPPHMHRRNAAERAIRTFKNHFIAGLCSCDPHFPLHLWDQLLPQAELSLNLLRGSRINPQLSAHAQVFGQFNFSSHPIGPPGTQVLVHEKPTNRASWAPHATEGWYLGPALESYRCYRIWTPTTRRQRICDTISWFPTKVAMPQSSSLDTIQAALHDIRRALLQPHPASPLPPLSDSNLQALRTMTELFEPTLPSHVDTEPLDSTKPAFDHAILQAVQDLTLDGPDRLLRVNPSPDHNQPPPAFGPRSSGRFVAATQHLALLSFEARTPILDASNADWQHTSYKAIHPDTGDPVEYKDLLTSSDGLLWEECCADEIGRLAQGYKTILGTDTIHFIRITDMPADRRATYLRLVVADRPTKTNPRRVRFTVGGDRINYPGDVSTKTSGLTTAKLLLNSVISTPGARFCTFDIKDFYLNTPMEHYEYMRIPVHQIPQVIFELYNLQELVHNGFVYVEIRKGMYGLPQAGILANQQLVPHLAKHGYIQSQHTHGLFIHTSRPIMFALVVDDFGVKYVGREHAEHLKRTLEEAYTITTDWTGDTFLGMHLDWDYAQGIVDISMPGYIAKALQRFDHPTPARPEHAPHTWTRPQYGAPVQYTVPTDTSLPLTPQSTKRLQEIIGVLLYYARCIDNTMLPALGSLAAAQAHGTQATADACTKLLNYAATHPDAVLRYKASDMVLHIHSDASYLSEPGARSRVGGFFFLGNGDAAATPLNGAIQVVSQIMTNVLASAAEAEVGGLFTNGQTACPVRTTLIEMGHPQPPTPIVTDNECAQGIANDTVKQRRSKAIDMRFYWIRDRVAQKQFVIHWQRGATNLADYFTKHHPPSHHQRMRPKYLQEQSTGRSSREPPVAHCEGVLKSSGTTQDSPHTSEPHVEPAREPGHQPARAAGWLGTNDLTGKDPTCSLVLIK